MWAQLPPALLKQALWLYPFRSLPSGEEVTQVRGCAAAGDHLLSGLGRGVYVTDSSDYSRGCALQPQLHCLLRATASERVSGFAGLCALLWGGSLRLCLS